MRHSITTRRSGTSRAGTGRAGTGRTGWRGLAVALPLALLLGGCAELYEDVSGQPDALGPDAKVSTGSDPARETYPNLGSVPDGPPRRPSDQASRQGLRDSLASDRANARYSNEPLRGRGVEDAGGGDAGASEAGRVEAAGLPDAPEPPDIQTGASTTGAGELADGESLSPGGGGPAAAPSDEGTSAPRPAAKPARTASGGQPSAPAASTPARPSEVPDDVPQIEQSQQGEPIEIPDMPDFVDPQSPGTAPAGEPEAGAGPGVRDARSTQLAQAGGGDAAVMTPRRSELAREGSVQGRRAAVIQFAHGSTALDGNDREVLRKVARIARERDLDVRVIGHASSRTAAMGLIEHRMANFDISLKRAETVADALVSMGVARERIKVEGRSDRDPVYHEFMSTGEAGNRRAEIYLGG